jgi:hypothetical protein
MKKCIHQNKLKRVHLLLGADDILSNSDRFEALRPLNFTPSWDFTRSSALMNFFIGGTGLDDFGALFGALDVFGALFGALDGFEDFVDDFAGE